MAESKDTTAPKEVKIVTTVRTDVVDSETPTTEETGAKKTEKKPAKKSSSKSKKTDNNGKWWEKLLLPAAIIGSAIILKCCTCFGCNKKTESEEDRDCKEKTEVVAEPQPVDSAKIVNYMQAERIYINQAIASDSSLAIAQQVVDSSNAIMQTGDNDNAVAGSKGPQYQNTNRAPVSKPVVRKPKPVVVEVPGDTIVVRKPVVVVVEPTPKPECTTEINVTKAWSLCSDAASFTAAYYGIKVH